MNLFEALTVTAFGLAVAIASITALPRPKPAADETPAPVTIVTVQKPAATNQQRVDAVASELKKITNDVEAIKEAVRVQQALKSMPDETGDVQ